MGCLKDKYILVCRTSGKHRLPLFQRVASKGPFASPTSSFFDESILREHPWIRQVYTDDLEKQGAHLVFIHPSLPPWIEGQNVIESLIIADTSDPERCYEATMAWIAEEQQRRCAQNEKPFPGFAGVLSFDEFSIMGAAYIAEKFNLPGTPSDIVSAVRDKAKLRWLSEQAGLPAPRALRFRISDVLNRILDIMFSSEAMEASHAAHLGKEAIENTLVGEDYSTLTPDERGEQILAGARERYETNRLRNQGGTPIPPSVFSSGPESLSAHWSKYYEDVLDMWESRNLPKLSFPLVLKPTSGAGSNFVRRVHSLEDLILVCRDLALQCQEADELKNSLKKPSSSTTPDAKNTVVTTETIDGKSNETTNTPQDTLLQFKWKHWGLGDVDDAFVLEEMMIGSEVDIDLLVQDGRVTFLSVSDNFECAGPANYFMESGGQNPSSLSVRVQLALRALALYFFDYIRKDCIASKKNTQAQICGAFHFEAMVVRNMPWLEKNPAFALFSGPGFVVIPVEVNQRLGGSEVSCLTSSVYGIDLGYEAAKIAVGIPTPQYFSLHPSMERMNRIGWDRFASSTQHLPFCPLSKDEKLSLPKPVSEPLHLTLPLPQTLIPAPEADIEYANLFSLAKAISKDLGYPFFDASKPDGSHLLTPFEQQVMQTKNFSSIDQVIEASQRNPLFACSINFITPHGGIVRTLYIQPEAMSDPSYQGSLMWNSPGDFIQVPPAGFDFVGFLVASGSTAFEAQSNLYRLSEQLVWAVEKEALHENTIEMNKTDSEEHSVGVKTPKETNSEPKQKKNSVKSQKSHPILPQEQTVIVEA